MRHRLPVTVIEICQAALAAILVAAFVSAIVWYYSGDSDYMKRQNDRVPAAIDLRL